MKNELHPIQQQLLEKYGINGQLDKLREELRELEIEIDSLFMHFFYDHIEFTNDGIVEVQTKFKGNFIERFYREFLDVRNLMQQIESKLDPQLLEKYEAEMFEKIKTKYLNK